VGRNEKLSQIALRAALQLRIAQDIVLWDALCVYDLAERLGAHVSFVDIPSLEGMYVRQASPRILITMHRPAGRQAFTCAHEIAHHYFKHGKCLGEILTDQSRQTRYDPDEFLANSFAGFLLMPKLAVERAFTVRGWDMEKCTPLQVYVIAGWLGVGYSSLLNHMSRALQLLTPERETELLRTAPKELRIQLLGKEVSKNVVVVDTWWTGRPIDIEMGDYVLAPSDTIFEPVRSGCMSDPERNGDYMMLRGATPGIGRLHSNSTGWASFVRVSRRNYIGHGQHRHTEDPEPDDE